MAIGANSAAGEKLRSFVERMERLLDDVEALQEDLKQLKAEIKGDGFNVQALTRLVAIRRSKRRAETESILLNDLVLYAHAIGTPLDLTLPTDDDDRTAAERAPA